MGTGTILNYKKSSHYKLYSGCFFWSEYISFYLSHDFSVHMTDTYHQCACLVFWSALLNF